MSKIVKKVPYVTYILIFLNLILFFVEIRLGGSTNLDTLDRLGALIPGKIDRGEWWRSINANFLHFGWLHLASNMLALLFVGRLVEMVMGSAFYLLIYSLSGIGSMLTCALYYLHNNITGVVLVGASAAIMGSIGTLLALSLRVWLQQKNALNRKRLTTVVSVIAIQFIFDNLIPQVSFYSHLFGLIIGFLLSSVLLLFKFNLKSPN